MSFGAQESSKLDARPTAAGQAEGTRARLAGWPKVDGWLVWPMLALMLASILGGTLWAHPMVINGYADTAYRIFYLMVPTGWNAFFCFGLVGLGSVMVLVTKKAGWDQF